MIVRPLSLMNVNQDIRNFWQNTRNLRRNVVSPNEMMDVNPMNSKNLSLIF